nr:diiron oxygenase [Melittangium boletus]
MNSVPQYRSPFNQWEERAAVRSMSMDFSELERDAQGEWFHAEASGIANHPEVIARGRRQDVLAALLLGYLDFTFHLEARCIEPVGRDISLHRLDAQYDAQMARDAIRVQCDEAFHALMCAQLADHVKSRVELCRVPFPEHLYFRRVRELEASTRNSLSAEQYAFCVAVVSETVITDSLQKDWQNLSLRPSVREVLLQHYKDEVRHSAYFSQALRIVWPQWSEEVKRTMAPLWSELVLAFTRIDAELSRVALRMAGFSEQDAQRIQEETLRTLGPMADRGVSYKLTLRAFREAGVLGGQREYEELAGALSPNALVP